MEHQDPATIALANLLQPLPSLQQLSRMTFENDPPPPLDAIYPPSVPNDTRKPEAPVKHFSVAANHNSTATQCSPNKPTKSANTPSNKAKKRKKKSQNAETCSKRPRTAEKQSLESIRKAISKSAQVLRKAGVVPTTLFFPCLPVELERDIELRSAIGVTTENFKTIHAHGKKMAWVTFSNESECLDTFLSLRTAHPALKVSLHNMNQTEGTGKGFVVKNGQIFDDRVKGILSRGGIGNTLLFRNLPVETECTELESVFGGLLKNVMPACRPLGIRTALSRNGQSRNFWAVHSDMKAAKRAFVTLFFKEVTFRCGKTTKLHPIIHDDSSDSDSKKRRERAAALGHHQSNGKKDLGTKQVAKKTSLDLLEDYLVETQQTFFFMPDR